MRILDELQPAAQLTCCINQTISPDDEGRSASEALELGDFTPKDALELRRFSKHTLHARACTWLLDLHIRAK